MQKSIHHEERVLCVRFERDEQIENTLKKNTRMPVEPNHEVLVFT